jgi:hypothetical protein
MELSIRPVPSDFHQIGSFRSGRKWGDMIYRKGFCSPSLVDALEKEMRNRLSSFTQDSFRRGITEIKCPRMVQAFGDAGLVYEYSGNSRTPQPWTPFLLQLKEKIQPLCSHTINFVLVNLYRGEKDSLGGTLIMRMICAKIQTSPPSPSKLHVCLRQRPSGGVIHTLFS